MSVRKANQFYKELTLQQKHFVDNKTINTTMSIKHWMAFLKKASDFDTYCDKARLLLGTKMTLLILAIIGLTITAFALENYYWLLGLAVLGVWLYDTVQTRSNFAKRDINNYLRLFFMPFLEAIKSKAGEEAKLSASLDFRDPMKSVTPNKYDYQYSGSKRNVSLYEPKMIIAGVTLLDGSYLETVVLDEIRKISYRNANGKHKSKTKTLHRFFIRLSANKKNYKPRNPLPEHIEVSEEGDQYIFKLKEKNKELGAGILNPALFFTVLGGLYKQLEPLGGTPPLPMGNTDQPGAGFIAQDIPADNRLVETLVWDDVFFNQYDRDSFSRPASSRFFRNVDNDTQNTFDS